MLETLFAARRHHDRVTHLEFELHTTPVPVLGREEATVHKAQDLKQLDCSDLGLTQLAAGLELNTIKKNSHCHSRATMYSVYSKKRDWERSSACMHECKMILLS